MANIIESGNIISFADYQDVFNRDQRLFDSNESLTDDVVENLLIRATERIITNIRSSSWWQSYYLKQANIAISSRADIPSPDINRIISRQNDFADLCVYLALSDFILPLVADFGNEDSSERKKMGYYTQKADKLFGELITAGDWYDFDDDSIIESSEKDPGYYNLKRVR
jgi:hypothetical protein